MVPEISGSAVSSVLLVAMSSQFGLVKGLGKTPSLKVLSALALAGEIDGLKPPRGCPALGQGS